MKIDKEAIEDLIKSLDAEELSNLLHKATDNSTGFSTRQSLRDQVEDFTRRNTPLFDMLPREDVINPIHQWDAITSLASGIASYAGAIDTVGVDSDPIITRYSEAVKYYRTTTTVGQFTDAMSRPQLKAQDTVDEKAVQAVKQDIEEDIIVGANAGDNVRGMSNIIDTFAPGTNVVSGLDAAITATDNFDNLQKNIAEQGGQATHFMFNGEDTIDFKNIFTEFTRYNDPITNKFGYTVQKYLSSFGEVDIMYDQFVPAKAGGTSTGFVLDIGGWFLGEPTVNGASGLAAQDLARTGPKNTKLVNYYGLLGYPAPVWNGKVTNLG